MNEYQLLEEIGRGTSSCVYKGRKRETINFYAVHSIDKCMRQRVLANVKILGTLSHPNIIRLHEWYETASHFWVVTDLCISGDLHSSLKQQCKMKPESVRLLGSDICAGLFYMHAKGLLHCNLKPSNLLMNASASLVLRDFSLACPFQKAADSPLIGTPPYMAPELFLPSERKPPSMASDLWSLGCILYEMAAGEPPFKGRNLREILTNVLTQAVNRIEGVSEDLNGLIAHLLEKDPARRATWKDVLSCMFWGCALEDLNVEELPLCSAMKVHMKGQRENYELPWSESDVCAAVDHAVAVATATDSISSSIHDSVDSPRDWACITKELDFSPSKPGDAAILGSHAVRPAKQGQGEKLCSTTLATPHSAVSFDSDESNYLLLNGNGSLNGTHRVVCHVNSTTLAGPQYMSGACEASELSDSFTQNPLEEKFAEAVRRISISDLLWCSLDANARPLWGNAHIERPKVVNFIESEVPFRVMGISSLVALSERDFESFMKSVYVSLFCHTGTIEQKENILKYLASIVNGPTLSNRLVNSSIMALCVKMAGLQRLSVSCRAQAASLAGQLVRYSNYIAGDLIKANMLPRLLCYFSSEPNVIVRCKLITCIGELIYYIAAQREHVCAEWQPIEEDARKVFALALEAEDPLIQHYAVKAIENLSTNLERCTIFCTRRIIECLLVVYALGPSRSRHMCASSLSAALRLSAFKEELIPVILASKELPVSSYVELLEHPPTPRCAQVLLSFLNVTLLKSMISLGNPFAMGWAASPVLPGSAAWLTSSMHPRQAKHIVNTIVSLKDNIIDSLCNHADRVADPMAAKLVVFTLLLGCLGGRVFAEACTASHLAFIARLMEESDPYLQQCTTALLTFVEIFVTQKLSIFARGVSPTTTPLNVTLLQRIFSSPILTRSIHLCLDAFESLCNCLSKAVSDTSYRPYEDVFNTLAFHLVQQLETVVQHQDAIFATLVGYYIKALKYSESERRFVALYFLTSLMTSLVSDLETPRGLDTPLGKEVLFIISSVTDILQELLLHADPIPKCTLRLLYTCADWNAAGLASVASVNLLSYIWNYLSCADDVDLFYPLYLLHTMLFHGDQRGEICFVVEQKHLAVLNRVCVTSMKNGLRHVVHICCQLIESILRIVKMDVVSFTDLQCSIFMNDDAVETVFLPLCNDELTSKHVVGIILDLACLYPSVYDMLLSVSGLNALQETLGKQPINEEAAGSLLRAFLYAIERKGRSEIRHLANDKRLMSALKNATGGNYPTAVSSYASQLYQAITDQQVLSLF